MDRDAGGGYRMTFATPGSPAARGQGGARGRVAALSAVSGGGGRHAVAAAGRVPHRGEALVSDDGRVPVLGRRHHRRARRDRRYGGGGVFDRHVTRWNDNCVFCHNVAPNPGRDPSSGAFETTVAELGIACEACHGPGAAHARANADPARRYALHLGGRADPTIVNPSRLAPARAADLCGRCHGQRITADVGPFLTHGDPFVAGDDLARYSAPLGRDTPLRGQAGAFAARFWDDGTPRLTAYEYQGLLQSALRAEGRPHLHQLPRHARGRSARPDPRTRFAGREAARATGCAPVATRRWRRRPRLRRALAPRSGGRRGALRRLPHATHRVRRARHPPQPPHRHPEAAARGRPASDARPDACTLCHVEGVPGGQAGAGATLAALAGEPVARAVAADALGRAPSFARRRARAPARDAARGDGEPIAIRPSGTSPGGACAGWPLPAPRPARGWPPTTIRRPTPRRACGW